LYLLIIDKIIDNVWIIFLILLETISLDKNTGSI